MPHCRLVYLQHVSWGIDHGLARLRGIMCGVGDVFDPDDEATAADRDLEQYSVSELRVPPTYLSGVFPASYFVAD
jgi:hypothetical protein